MRIQDIPEIDRLSTPEKILLVEELWDHIASDPSAVPIPLKVMSMNSKGDSIVKRLNPAHCSLWKNYKAELIGVNDLYASVFAGS